MCRECDADLLGTNDAFNRYVNDFNIYVYSLGAIGGRDHHGPIAQLKRDQGWSLSRYDIAYGLPVCFTCISTMPESDIQVCMQYDHEVMRPDEIVAPQWI